MMTETICEVVIRRPAPVFPAWQEEEVTSQGGKSGGAGTSPQGRPVGLSLNQPIQFDLRVELGQTGQQSPDLDAASPVEGS